MRLRAKLVLLSGAPMFVAMALIGWTLKHQTLKLMRDEQALVQDAFLQSKETELKHYVELARNTLARIADGPGTLDERKASALATVSRMQFGDNGYFFVYDQHGQLMIDPKSLPLSGVDFCDPNTPQGADAAHRLLATARDGGGPVRYPWHKPSSQEVVPKLAYVSTVPTWNWVIGTGIYLDDVQQALNGIEREARANIESTRNRIYVIAALCMLIIGLAGLALNIQDHRVSRDKLRGLARRVVHSQEAERVRVARELHDGVVQVLASSRYLLETAQCQTQGPARHILDRGIAQVSGALEEIRRVSHGLRPALLDDLGLAPALTLLTSQIQESSGIAVRFVRIGAPDVLPAEQATALFRISQEALQNACQHAQAKQIDVVLRGSPYSVALNIVDDGRGFDLHRVSSDGSKGIGLRNMRERAESLGGALTVSSSGRGTRIEVWLRREAPMPPFRHRATSASRDVSALALGRGPDADLQST